SLIIDPKKMVETLKAQEGLPGNFEWNYTVPNYSNITWTSSVSSKDSGNVNFNGDIVLPDVTNPKEFAASLKDVVKNDVSVQKLLKESTIGALSPNYNTLGIRRY
ncbi:MAG: hypothetical protein NC124_18150, partial [Clostridium sp.]|nr:hypothetical protein [Clostridium sp.]